MDEQNLSNQAPSQPFSPDSNQSPSVGVPFGSPTATTTTTTTTTTPLPSSEIQWPNKKPKNNFKQIILGVLAILFVGVVAGAAYYVSNQISSRQGLTLTAPTKPFAYTPCTSTSCPGPEFACSKTGACLATGKTPTPTKSTYQCTATNCPAPAFYCSSSTNCRDAAGYSGGKLKGTPTPTSGGGLPTGVITAKPCLYENQGACGAPGGCGTGQMCTSRGCLDSASCTGSFTGCVSGTEKCDESGRVLLCSCKAEIGSTIKSCTFKITNPTRYCGTATPTSGGGGGTTTPTKLPTKTTTQPPTCTDTSWSPATSTTCTTGTLTQTSNCGKTRVIAGTKVCGTAGACMEIYMYSQKADGTFNTTAMTQEQKDNIKVGNKVRLAIKGNKANLQARFRVSYNDAIITDLPGAVLWPEAPNQRPRDGFIDPTTKLISYYDFKVTKAGTYKFEGFVSTTPLAQTCAGVAGVKCPTGFSCQVKSTTPDAQGICIAN